MKLQFAQVPTKEQIKAALEQHLPQFQYSFRIGKFVDCKQTFFIGATIVPKKDGIVINSSFPSAGANMFFTLFMFATGILVGLVLWLIVWKGGQDKVRDQIARVLGQVFNATNPIPAAPGQPQLAPGQPPQMAHGQPQMGHGQPPMGQPQMGHGQPPMGQPHMPPPGQPHQQMPQPHQHQQHQPQMQQPQAQGFSPGMQVFVAPGDGQRYPATVVSSANGQYQCMMPNGQPYWFPAQNVSVS
jgi:hypothetical protein